MAILMETPELVDVPVEIQSDLRGLTSGRDQAILAKPEPEITRADS